MKIPYPGECWAFRFEVPKLRGEVLEIYTGGLQILSIKAENEKLTCTFTTIVENNAAFSNVKYLNFILETIKLPSYIQVEWVGYSVKLYADGELVDEEWPVGELPQDDWEVKCTNKNAFEFTDVEENIENQTSEFIGPMQYFNLTGSNTGVGDCMPFSRDGRYCLYYLFDRREHKSKAHLGAHQWAQISSSDLKKWTIHPMAIPITEQWEGSICTGSLIQKDGLTYAFYAVRMYDGSPAKMTWAVSSDGVHFEKSGKYFTLTEPYEPVSARDPMVFLGADGKYHMLVTTSLVNKKRYNGCLAHMVSDDLLSWTQLDPFIVPGYDDQPECPDYFEWNGWYYLVFSNFATARYRISKEPFGPWQKPEYDVLDTTENQVAKTAVFEERRLVTGFLARHPRTYAGNAITHELIQHSDGTLGVCFVPEILPEFSKALDKKDVLLSDDEGRSEVTLAEALSGFRLRAELTLEGCAVIGGLTITVGNNEHRLTFDKSTGIISVMRPDHHYRFNFGDPRLQLSGVDISNKIKFDMIIKDDILDIAFCGGKAMVVRLSNSCSAGCNLALYVQTGAVKLKKITLEPLVVEA